MSDRQGQQPARLWANIGIGMQAQFRCDTCRQNRPTLGRKKTRTGWLCVHCVKARDAQKAAA